MRPSSCFAPGTETTYLTCKDEVAGPTLEARQMLADAAGRRRLLPRFPPRPPARRAFRSVPAGSVSEQRRAARLPAHRTRPGSSPADASSRAPANAVSRARLPRWCPRLRRRPRCYLPSAASRSLPSTVAPRTTTGGNTRTPQSGVAAHPGARTVGLDLDGRLGPDSGHTGPLSPHAIVTNPPNPRERSSRPAEPTGRIPCV